MKIINEGTPMNKARRFYCGCCGCVFDAEKHEYELAYVGYEPTYYCRCPNCDVVCSYSTTVPEEG